MLSSALAVALDPAYQPSDSILCLPLPSSKYRLLPDTEIVPSGRQFSQQNKNFEALTEKMQDISFGFSTNSIIKTISSRTETYTAVQDCWCVGRIKGSSGNPCGIKLDDVLLFNLDILVYAPIVFPVKKGQTVSITGAGTICSFNFFS